MARTLVLAEDSYIVREGVRVVLEQAGYRLAAVVENYDELMQAVEAHHPDVVVTDIRMPPTRTNEGITAARQIRQNHPDTGVVVLSQYVEPEYALRLLQDGTAGFAYLLKERVGDSGELADAVEKVAAGESKIDPKVVDALIEGRAADRPGILDRLTPRETEVLELLAAGKSNAGIAAQLYLSERGVEKHINSVFTKLDLFADSADNRRVMAALVYLSERGRE